MSKPKILSNVDSRATSSNTKQIKPSPDQKETKRTNWYIFTFSFLSLSDIGCDHLLTNKADGFDRGLILSILFNLKHSLEIVMKTISYHVCGEFDKGHDLQDLIEKLKNKTRKRKNNKAIKKHLDNLEKLLMKYRQLNLFQGALKSSLVFNDKNNKLFKYPDNDKDGGGIVLDINYSTLVDKLTKSDVKDIKKDIGKIKDILDSMKGIIKD